MYCARKVDTASPVSNDTVDTRCFVLAQAIATHNNRGIQCMNEMRLQEASLELQTALGLARGDAQSSLRSSCRPHQKSNCVQAAHPAIYDEGFFAFSEPILLNSSKSLHVSTGIVLYNLGQLSMRLGDDEEATTLFLQAKYVATEATHLVAILHNMAHIEYRRRNYQEAICILKETLHHAKKDSRNALDIASTMNSLGVAYFHSGEAHYGQASAMYQDSLAICRAHDGENFVSKEISTTLNNIGRLNFMNGEYTMALKSYKQSLEMRSRLLGSDHLDTAATAFNIGQLHHRERRWSEALSFYEVYVGIARLRLGRQHGDVAMALQAVAQIHHEKKAFHLAKEKYQEALQITRATFGSVHVEVSTIWNRLGNLLYEAGEINEAVRSYNQALKIDRVLCSDENSHPNLAITLSNLGQIHKVRGELATALKFYKEVAIIQRERLGDSSLDLAETLSAIGLIHFESKAYDKALREFQEVLNIERRVHGENSLDVASTLNSMGLALYKLRFDELAMQSFERCLAIRRLHLGSNHEDVAFVLYNMATIFFDSGDDDKALLYYQQVLRVEHERLGQDHPGTVHTLRALGQVHQRRGELGEALATFQKAVDLQKSTTLLLKDKTSLVQTLVLLGNVYLQKGDAKGVVDTFSEVTRLSCSADMSDFSISGFLFYGLAKLHPEAAAAA
jgi:tetratricopeptide (TPR) repeat protein